MLLCLSSNNWFLFILLAQEIRLSRCLLLPPIPFPFVSLLYEDLYRGENFSTTGAGVPSFRSLTPLSVCFPRSVYSHIFPSVCISASSTSTAPSCLHIAWSSTTKGAVWLAGLVFPVLLIFHFPFLLFIFYIFFLSWLISDCLNKNAGPKRKEMTRRNVFLNLFPWKVMT